MLKRPASESPLDGRTSAKKQKLETKDSREDRRSSSPVTSPSKQESPKITSPKVTAAETNDSANAAETDNPVNAMHVDKAVIADASSGLSEEEVAEEKVSKKKKAKKANRPIAECFHPWGTVLPKPVIPLPDAHEFRGCKPKLGDGAPRPPTKQPSAKTSNAASIPDLWEDRGYIFDQGSRYRKYVNEKPDNVDELSEDIDQLAGMPLKLINMNPRSKKDRTPKRTPEVYIYKNGSPKDWDDTQTIKCLNDRRRDAIERVTRDPPWTNLEREYLAELVRQFPDGSIWDWTEHHNYRFVDNYRWPTGLPGIMDLSDGRTVESVADEYRKHKVSYDKGEAPPEHAESRRIHKNAKGEDIEEEIEFTFFGVVTDKIQARLTGEPTDKKRKRAEDDVDGAEGAGHNGETGSQLASKKGKATPKKKVKADPKKSPAKKRATKKVKITAEETVDENETAADAVHPHAGQPQLSAIDEELYDLAGGNDLDQIRRSSEERKPVSSPSPAASGLEVGSPTQGHSDQVVAQDAPVDVSISAIDFAAIVDVTKVTETNEDGQVVESTQVVETAVEVATVEEGSGDTVAAQEVTTVTSTTTQTETVSPVAEQAATPPRAARALVIEENYDDDEEL
jgi:hypothetical protein